MKKTAVHKYLSGGLLALFTLVSGAAAQISSPTADKADSVSYPVSGGKDPLFIFFQPEEDIKEGSLSAVHPDGGTYDFQWSRFNPEIQDFDPPFQTDASLSESQVSALEDGGYRVRIFDGNGTDTSMVAWVMLNELSTWIDQDIYRTCDILVISGYASPDTLVYFDPAHPEALTRPLEFSFKWTSDNPDLKIPNDTIILRPNVTYAPPYRDTWYILTVTDESGMVKVDSAFYESIQTKAEFEMEYLNKFSGQFEDDLNGDWKAPNFDDWESSTGSMDATLTVRFVNKSENGAEFLWVLLDTLGGIREEVITSDTSEMPEFTYETADKYYYPYLYSYSEKGCVDSVKMEEGIYIEPSQLDIPNVFSPNGDGVNDYWYFKHQSIQSCKITVVDRTGKRVYKREIEDIYSKDDWMGWDGTMQGKGKLKAPEGQYYFIIEAMGYDGVSYKDPSIWSQMKIFGGAGTKDPGSGGTNPGDGTGGDTPQTLYTGWLYLYRDY